jgi:hypothetical protein
MEVDVAEEPLDPLFSAQTEMLIVGLDLSHISPHRIEVQVLDRRIHLT